MTEQDKVIVDGIIGIIKTEEQTDSVEEVRKLRGRENKTAKRFQIIYDFCDWLGYQGLAYETLYYGRDEDIGHLINEYLDDEEWSNREDEDINK